MGLPLSPQVFAIMSSLVEERSGLHYTPADMELFGERLSTRAVEGGFDSLLDYYYFLRYDPAGPAEADALIETLVVQETYFFREVEALEALVDLVLRARIVDAAAGGPRVRIWCAACVTGEEPLTLAILLARRGVLDAVDIVATDISARGLDRARAGVFGGRSLRALPRGGTPDRMTPRPGGRVAVDAAILGRVEFRALNLLDEAAVASLGVFDAILCRNVLIYFSETSVLRVLGGLSGALAENGVVLVGASESLMRFGGAFRCEEHGGSFFYRRPPL